MASNNFMEIRMGGGTLHLKVLRGQGGGGGGAQAVLEIWVESGWGRGGKRIVPFGGGGGE